MSWITFYFQAIWIWEPWTWSTFLGVVCPISRPWMTSTTWVRTSRLKVQILEMDILVNTLGTQMQRWSIDFDMEGKGTEGGTTEWGGICWAVSRIIWDRVLGICILHSEVDFKTCISSSCLWKNNMVQIKLHDITLKS